MSCCYYECLKRLMEIVVGVEVAYSEEDMNSAAKYYSMIYEEFDKCRNEFKEYEMVVWAAYFKAMRILDDDAVFDITEYIKKQQNIMLEARMEE